MTAMIHAQEFLAKVRPALEAADAGMLAQTVRARWRPDELCKLLRHEDVDVRRVAAVSLGLIGDMSVTPSLTRALRDTDEQVNQMAEHGLWSVWFRHGQPKATIPFREGMALMSTKAYSQAIQKFHAATLIDSQFAEGYNQGAIAHYFLSDWKQSIVLSRRTLRLIPTHFGAICGMGHCYMELGDLRQALRCYRRAVHINPHLTAIAGAIGRMQPQVGAMDDSGEYLVDQINL